MEKNTIIIVGVTILLAVILFGALANYVGEVAVDREQYEITGLSSSTNFTSTSLTNTLTPIEEGISSDSFRTATNVSLDFDGDGDYVNLTDLNYFDTVDFSINAWIETGDSRAAGNSIVGKRNTDTGTNIGYQMFLSSQNHSLTFILGDGSGTRLGSSNNNLALNNSQWHMVSVGVNRSNQANLYVDGTGYTDLAISTQPNTLNNNLDLVIGGEWHNAGLGAGWFNGSIEDVKFFNRRLLARDFRELYNQSALGRNLGKGIIVINYHGVNDTEAEEQSSSNLYVSQFTEQMAYLDFIGAETVTYKQVHNWKNGLTTLPEKPVILNFDDSMGSDYLIAKPIMDEYGFIGSWSINTNEVGNPNYIYSSGGYSTIAVTWEQLREMHEDGWEIISHGTYHNASTDLTISERQVWFNESKYDIINEIGEVPLTFVFPWHIANDTIHQECLQYYTYCVNISAAYTAENIFNHQNNFINSSIVRITTSNTTTLESFKIPFGIWDYNISLKLNSNNGTIAYDSSGNNNHGTITGATWRNDGSYKTLVKGVDYTLNSATGVLVLSSEYLYNWIEASWDYENIEEFGFHVPIIKIIAGLCSILVLSVCNCSGVNC